MTKEETMALLEKFFNECLKYWEETLMVDSDTSTKPFLNAICEIPKTNPYKPNGEKLNKEWVDEFRMYKIMDCYGDRKENS